MHKWLNQLYQKSQLYFALVWIGVYCLANSLSNLPPIGIEGAVALAFNAVLALALWAWIKNNRLMARYGLCRAQAPASRFVWYIPLALFASSNLWFGVGVQLPAADTVCYILNMLCVGFLEEVIFRGLLFKALAKENLTMAIVVSSVTFGVGHMLNLVNGSGMGLLANACQVVGAIACGFLFVVIFCRGGSLVPCIIAHAVNNAVSIFGNAAGAGVEKQLVFYTINIVVVVGYTLVLCKTLPPKPLQNPGP